MITNLKQLYCDQLLDLYSAETQLIDALPGMVAKADNEDLRKAFSEHLEETREHKARLEKLCRNHNLTPGSEVCDAMKGLIKEANKHGDETQPGPVRDAVLIAAANRVEHYEIAGYGVARCFADQLDLGDDADILGKTLDEESAADEKVTKIATGGFLRSGVNEAAMA